MRLKNHKGENFLENHLMHVVNVGRPLNSLDEYCKENACKEIYDMEQNEILQLNAEVTANMPEGHRQ